MELIEAYRIIDKYLEPRIQPLGFSKAKSEDEAAVHYKSEKGLFRFKYEKESNILLLECAYEDKGESTEYETISKSLFTLADADERDCRSAANEFDGPYPWFRYDDDHRFVRFIPYSRVLDSYCL